MTIVVARGILDKTSFLPIITYEEIIMKETFAIRLQKALDAANMKAADLARATGTPESVAKVKESYTGQFLKKVL